MRTALISHPNLSRLMTLEHREPVVDYVNRLLKVLLKSGFDEELALRSCRVLVNIVMNFSLAELTTPADRPDPGRRSRLNRRERIFFKIPEMVVPGDAVLVSGLVDVPKFNGHEGVVSVYDPATGCYLVKVPGLLSAVCPV